MFNFKKKTHVALELNDYLLRVLVKKGEQPAQWETYEILLAKGIVQDGMILDEVALFKILKEHLALFGGKKQPVRTFVPDTSVLLKTFEHPEDVVGDKLKAYVQMELGRTIHLPFHEPLVDVYDPVEGDGQATMFAAPSEEVTKFVGLLLDTPLTPEAVDIRALCNLRVLEHLKKLDEHKTYMLTNWSINELSVCIYSNGQIEFLRFQTIDTDLTNWHGVVDSQREAHFTYNGAEDEYRMLILDRVLELDRIMNFFRFSLHKGERTIDEIIVMGDNPWLSLIRELLVESLPVPIMIVDDQMIQQFYPTMKAKHVSLIGLALKEV
ncbi:type IV pilus biogenesis protein PilM [Lysinibacillus piscis]|uniref:Pilus assembly protein PilM n=1 Tax=Lysinibacillus piscis TaxID=2518931 RepID=A0ABQ5NGS6_9BACI|nr:pilus assembly protein PilM [Lysinibacillus sp. KH24]GLC87261.1 hypothetical protein LYSBPC_03880 [Lysinibacillus sp. KH24]